MKTAKKILAALLLLIILAVLILIIQKVCALRAADRAYEKIAEGGGTREGLEELKEKNGEVIGWLTVADTAIDTAVVQAEDNVKYLNTDVNGGFSFGGCPFLDHRNDPAFTDPYSVIYGHHMEDSLMFGDLSRFAEDGFLEKTRTGTFTFPDGRMLKITFFACVKTKEGNSRIFDPRMVKNNWNEEGFLPSLLENSLYKKEEIEPGDRILVLSTCETADTEDRIVVFGKVSED